LKTNLNFVVDNVAAASAASFNLRTHNEENKCRRFIQKKRSGKINKIPGGHWAGGTVPQQTEESKTNRKVATYLTAAERRNRAKRTM
jgi:hypothetical protein